MNGELERFFGKHLAMEIEEVFWERTTPEPVAPQHVPGALPTPQTQTADPGEQRHWQELLNDDMPRTQQRSMEPEI